MTSPPVASNLNEAEFLARLRFLPAPETTAFRYDQQYYKQAGERTLTLRTYFKFVWGARWGVKKQPVPGCDSERLRFFTS
jgi:hypothetical protein